MIGLGLVAAGCAPATSGAGGARAAGGNPPFEVWLIDQSDSPGQNHGGTLYIFDGADLTGANAAAAAPRERIDLAGATAALCMQSTNANPVRPHMLLFNNEQTHAVLSFVASGHVVVFDAARRAPLTCVRTTESAFGRQAHAAFPAPDGSFIIVANQNGKLLERIDANFATNTFRPIAQATLNLARCTTPSGAPCQAPELRPDNAPICPVIDSGSRYAFVTLRGGGMFVVDVRATPMRIVAEYDMTTVKGNGCGGVEAGGQMYINSGGRPGRMEHLSMYGFDVYRFPLSGFADSRPNRPAPAVVFSAPGEHDSHGMVVLDNGSYIWVADRHANVIEVLSARDGARVNTIPITGPLSADPAPDLIDVAPAGTHVFVALRGPTPLSGDPHIASGETPGLGVITVAPDRRNGLLTAVIRISNRDGNVERADAHAVRVRLR